MTKTHSTRQHRIGAAWGLAGLGLVAACAAPGPAALDEGPYAPGIDVRKPAVDGIEVGARLIEAGEYELALDAYTRAALDHGMTADVLTGVGTANLGLGRLGQAEGFLRRAVEADPDWPEAWNNLGVLLMEKGEIAEAQGVFRKAYALDNGESDSIRENLRLALAKMENPGNTALQNEEFKLVQRDGVALLQKTP